jgi:hypothetical protein
VKKVVKRVSLSGAEVRAVRRALDLALGHDLNSCYTLEGYYDAAAAEELKEEYRRLGRKFVARRPGARKAVGNG